MGKMVRAIGYVSDEDYEFEVKNNDNNNLTAQLYKEPKEDITCLGDFVEKLLQQL